DVAPDALANAKKLQAGRIDYWFVTYNTATYTFRSLNYDLSDFKIAHTVSRAPIYMGANLSLPVEMAEKLTDAFAAVKKNGWYKKLLEKYDVVDVGEPPGPTSQK